MKTIALIGLSLFVYTSLQAQQQNIKMSIKTPEETAPDQIEKPKAPPIPVKIIKDTVIVDQIYTSVQELPEFPGGYNALLSFLSSNIHYPAEAITKGITGRVYVKIVVYEDGSIHGVNILRSSNPIFNAECLRIIKKMPNWKPGRQNGVPVKVWYTIPISFSITK